MTRFAYPLPRGAVENDIDLETAPNTSRIVGGALSAYNATFSLPANLLGNRAHEFMTETLNPGRFLTSQEYDQSELKVPGLSFPSGVSENVARLRFNRRRQEQVIENTLNQMPPGFLSSASRGVGSLVGLAIGAELDPAVIGIAKGTTALTSRLAPWLLNKLSGRAAKLTVTGGLGAAEGIAITTPFALTEFQNQKDLGFEPSALSIFANLGIGAGLGGTLRLAVGFKKPVMKIEEHQRAQSVAVNHLMNGKPAYVESIIKNGAYQTAKESGEFGVMAGELNRILPEQIQKAENEIREELASLSKKIKKKGLSETIANFETAEEFVSRLKRLREKPSDFLSEEEQALNKRFRSQSLSKKESSVLKKAFDISEKDEIKRTPVEKEFLEKLNTKEEEVIEEETNILKEKKKDLETKREETSEKNLKEKLKNKINELESRILKDEERLSDLKKLSSLKKKDKEILNAFKKLNKLKEQKHEFEVGLKSNEIFEKNMNSNLSPVTEAELRSQAAWINDWRSSFSYSIEDAQKFANTVSELAETVEISEQQGEILETLNILKKEEKLSAEAEKILDNIEKENEVIDKISSSLDKYFDCIVSRGE